MAALLVLIPLSLFAQTGTGTSAFSITRSSQDGIQLHFELPQWSMESSTRNGETLQKVSVADAQYIYIGEEETLPVFATMIAIPYSGGVSLRQLGSDLQTQSQVRLGFDAALTTERIGGRYSDALYPAANAVISEPQVLRDFRVVSVNIYPFQYDQESKQLIVRSSMDIRLDFDSGHSSNEIAPPLGYSSAFEPIYRGLILNYEQMLDRDVTYTSPRLLVIYGNYSDATYLSKVNEYVTWKKQKGYLVTAVSTATTGTTDVAIKTYIQTQYNNITTRPDYIVLIGDSGTGSMQIPTNGSYTDYYYTWMNGAEDRLGDMIIGRISVETSVQMVYYMAKIVSLEQIIDISTASWLDRMVLVGDTAHSGISTIYTNQYIEDIATPVNPDYTYTEEFNAAPSNTNINTAINAGVAFYNYRGYIGMSGWPSYIAALNNQWKLFHAVIITCATGNFSGGEATTESVVRKGTAATLGGSVTAIGMATSSTATPQNNCLDVGIFHCIYNLGARDMGTAMLYGKLYLNAIYGISNPTEAVNFANYCNLIGDPTAEVFVSIPSTFTVTAPSAIPAGTPNLEVTVKDASNQPVEGASVTLTHSSGAQFVAFTDAAGYALLSFNSALSDSMALTVNKHDFKPAVQQVYIGTAGGPVYNNQTIVDSESGNGNGVADSGETVELFVSLRNTTSSALPQLTGTVTSSDPYVTLIESSNIMFNPIAAGSTGQNSNSIVLEIAPNCPDQHRVVLSLELESLTNRWTVLVPVVVGNGKLNIQSYTFVGAPGNIVNPGDQYPMTISLTNAGNADLTGINAKLRSHDMFITIPDSLGYYGNIAHGVTVGNTSNTFTVSARSTCMDGMTIPLELYLYNSNGFEETVPFTLTIGQTSVTDPLGQDAYGYFIFDQGDIGYDQRPTYQWIGIAPSEGGTGTALSLTDPGNSGDEGDQVGAVAIQTVSLPFSFSYYGVNYTQASISSNGFIAFGDTDDADWRNWRMPDAGGPSPMIAVFWDDLEYGTGSNVYTYYNSSLHYYVVEWFNLLNGYNSSSVETFQAILYDPVFYPTHTGDGQIKLQYKVINNVDLGNSEDHFPHGNYATVGIEDHTATIGLEYTYNNTYPTAAAPLTNEMALFITTRPLIPDYPYVVIEQANVLDANANNHLEPGESASLSIRLGNRGLVNATGVSAVLSSTDPYVTITAANATYGTIVAQGNAYPLTNYALTVSPSCPADHAINFTLAISSATGSWSYSFPLTVYVPELGFSNIAVNDVTGDQNGILDPGETAVITIRLNNIGEIPSTAGTASLSCSTPGISINTATDTFPILAAGAYETLSFNISASSGMTDGTLVQLNFNATAGSTTASTVEYLEVGAPMEVLIGNGTSTQYYPLDRWYNYSAHEAIYLASEIAMAGTLKSLAFYKESGSDLNPISAVSIYMKNTSAASLTTGDYSTSGYTLVYSGSYPNNATTGWMEVDLNPMFVYDGVSNLAILTVKGYEPYISNYPMWTYTSVSPSRARQNNSDSAAPTSLSASPNLPNIRLEVFPDIDMLMPPQNLAATASHQSVYLTWSAPVVGTPTGYRIYRNSVLLTTVTALSYTDLAVTNGTTYNYYLIAVYSDGTSDPTSTVSATPNAVAPTNLTAIAGNTVVDLSWTGPTGRGELDLSGAKDRTIISYRIYRGGVALTTVTGTSYHDTGLTNGVPYSYYVTTVYANPAGESGASNTATATPNMLFYVILGTGTSVNTTTQNAPINISDRSNHGQSVYTAAELNAAGVVGPVMITGLGYYVVSAPLYNLLDFVIRVKHTTAGDASNWHTADGLVTVYSNPAYMPTAGGYDMLAFSTPFEWNGIDNILIDSSFNLVTEWNLSGTQQYTYVNSGYRFTYSDTEDQTNVFSGGTAVARRYNVRLSLQPVSVGPLITTAPSSIPFGNVAVNSNSVQQFTVQNTGDQILTGTITTPAGYTVALAAREDGTRDSGLLSGNADRNILTISVPAGQTKTYNLSFTPTAVATYNGNVVVATNAANTPTVNIAVSGTGTGALATVNPLSIPYGDVVVNATSAHQFTVQNSGNVALTGTITTPAGYSVALVTRESGDEILGLKSATADRNTLSISVPAGQTSTFNLTFAPTAIAAYNGNVVLATNAVTTPTVNIAVTGNGIITSLPAPVLTISSSGANTVLTWNAVTYALEYQVFSATDPYGTYTLLTTLPGLTYTDTRGLARVFYYVKAIRN